MTSKYGLVAVQAAIASSEGMNPIEAWNYSAATILDSPSSINKSCPKSTFLGLAELGVILGIKQGEYTKSVENKKYAQLALELLRENNSWANNPLKLWLALKKNITVKWMLLSPYGKQNCLLKRFKKIQLTSIYS